MSLFTFNSKRFKMFSGPLVGLYIFIGIKIYSNTLNSYIPTETFETFFQVYI